MLGHIYSGKSDGLLLQKNPPNTFKSFGKKEGEPLMEAERAPHRYGHELNLDMKTFKLL